MNDNDELNENEHRQSTCNSVYHSLSLSLFVSLSVAMYMYRLVRLAWFWWAEIAWGRNVSLLLIIKCIDTAGDWLCVGVTVRLEGGDIVVSVNCLGMPADNTQAIIANNGFRLNTAVKWSSGSDRLGQSGVVIHRPPVSLGDEMFAWLNSHNVGEIGLH